MQFVPDGRAGLVKRIPRPVAIATPATDGQHHTGGGEDGCGDE
jgi:hypothetical protein